MKCTNELTDDDCWDCGAHIGRCNSCLRPNYHSCSAGESLRGYCECDLIEEPSDPWVCQICGKKLHEYETLTCRDCRAFRREHGVNP